MSHKQCVHCGAIYSTATTYFAGKHMQSQHPTELPQWKRLSEKQATTLLTQQMKERA